LSNPEGDEQPHKYPVIFMEADVVIINKIDVATSFDFDMNSFCEIIAGLNPFNRGLTPFSKIR
jgi:hydrogenase nickel incorporation protein HypB